MGKRLLEMFLKSIQNFQVFSMKVTPDIKLFYVLASYHMKDSYIFVTCTVIYEE